MKTALLLLLTTLAASPLFAQYEKILADPTVSWAAEIELTLTPEEITDTWPYDSLNTSTVLKTVNTAPEDSPYSCPKTFSEHVEEIFYKEHQPIFADAHLTQRLTLEECLEQVLRANSVVTIDPETGEEKIQLWTHGWRIADLQLIKVRQLLLYRDKTASFELITRAMAPVTPDGRTPFWLAVPATTRKKRPSLADADITWARRLKTRGATLEVPTLHCVKGAERPFLSSFIQRVRQDPAINLWQPNDWKVSPFQEREKLLGINQIDTVVTFDPETYEERIQIVHQNLDIASLRQLQLIQDWYWDDRRQRFIVRLAAVAPMVEVRDSNGDLRYTKPLFYRKSW